MKDVVRRVSYTDSQNEEKPGGERWQNREGRFELTHPGITEGKHVLLVDDVITTGLPGSLWQGDLTGTKRTIKRGCPLFSPGNELGIKRVGIAVFIWLVYFYAL